MRTLIGSFMASKLYPVHAHVHAHASQNWRLIVTGHMPGVLLALKQSLSALGLICVFLVDMSYYDEHYSETPPRQSDFQHALADVIRLAPYAKVDQSRPTTSRSSRSSSGEHCHVP